ncbi:uncharacterized protein LOC102367241 isoform X2 [Latimeria chalumnae]|nr:PREDICTED: uncharacterized protein LOC102367241 isoform X2 [Latimeria chalumnae]|eukprot:XP_014345437.1 PREDICTED: uncharacterized protein LOC102367241 isoform X2 [Latimeria chalumnae]
MDPVTWMTRVFLLLFFADHVQLQFLRVNCSTRIDAIYKKDIELRCSYNTEIQYISLKRCHNSSACENIIDTLKNISEDENGRFKFHQEKHVVSLLINGAKPSDEGMYWWYIEAASGHDGPQTKVKVEAPYKIESLSYEKQKMEVRCNAVGYPGGQIQWLDLHGTDWTSSSELITEKTEDGRFNLTSKLTLQNSSIMSQYKCLVSSMTKDKTISKEIDVPFGQEMHEPQKQTAVVSVFTVVGILAIAVLAMWCYRKNRPRTVHMKASSQDTQENYAEV